MSSGFGRSINTQTRSPVPEPKDLVSKRVKEKGSKVRRDASKFI